MREKRDRNNLIIQKIKKGEYAVDIAKEFGVTESRISKIKKKYEHKNNTSHIESKRRNR